MESFEERERIVDKMSWEECFMHHSMHVMHLFSFSVCQYIRERICVQEEWKL